MPIALDPAQTVDIVLDLDSEKPEPRPAFICRHLSCRDVLELERLADEAFASDKKTDNAKTDQTLNRCLKLFLVGWKEIPVPFDSDGAINAVLSIPEKFELIAKINGAVQLDFYLKKKSLWQRRSEAAISARTASPNENATGPRAE